MMSLTRLFAMAVWLCAVTSVHAVQRTTFDALPITNVGTTGCPTNAVNCGTITVNGQVLKFRSYSSQVSTSTTDRKLVGSTVALQSGTTGGISVSTASASGVYGGDATNLQTWIDNNQGGTTTSADRSQEVVVFEAASDDFIWEKIGFSVGAGNNCANNNTAGSSTACDSDVNVFVGQGLAASLDFTSLCLKDFTTSASTTCSSSNAIWSGSQTGGTVNAGSGLNGFVALGGTQAAQGLTDLTTLSSGTLVNRTGRYLVVTGSLGSDLDDAFRITSISGVPEPGGLWLLASGLAGFLAARRKGCAAALAARTQS